MEPRRVGPRRVGAGGPHFRAFFTLPPHFSFFLPSTGCLLVEFWWWFLKAGTLTCARLEFSGCRVEPRRPKKAAGGSHHSPRAQTCTFKGPGLQKHQNSTRRPPRERRNNENCGGRGEKRAKFWAVRERLSWGGRSCGGRFWGGRSWRGPLPTLPPSSIIIIIITSAGSAFLRSSQGCE